MRALAFVTSFSICLTISGVAHGMGSFDPRAVDLAREIEAGWSAAGPDAKLPGKLVKKLVSLICDPSDRTSYDVRVVAIYGLAFATDEESADTLRGVGTRMLRWRGTTGTAHAALAWREARKLSPPATRWRYLVARAREAKNPTERLLLVAFLGRFFSQEAKADLVKLMEEETDDTLALHAAVVLARASTDTETVTRILEHLKKRPKLPRFGEGLEPFLEIIDGRPLRAEEKESTFFRWELERKVNPLK